MGRAMQSIFKAFKKTELCQLYIYPSIPDVDYCNSYYRITDVDVLKKFFSKKWIGHKIDKNEIKHDNALIDSQGLKRVYSSKKNVCKFFLRDFIWKKEIRNNLKLKEWLNEEKPTHIIVFPGDYCFFYSLVIQIKEYLNVPLIPYFMDNYFGLQKRSFLEKKYQKRLDKITYKLSQISSLILVLSKEMNDFYSSSFRKDIKTVMLGSNILSRVKICAHVKSLTYIGNFSNNRDQNLLDIGNALNHINRISNSSYKLFIYGALENGKTLGLFRNCQAIEYMGFVKGKMLEKAFSEADSFVHVESFDEAYSNLTKYSISTKISEILSSGRPVFAYGPDSVASIAYLKRTNSAFVVNDERSLQKSLEYFFLSSDSRFNIVKNATETAAKDLDCNKNSQQIYDCFLNI